MSLQSRLSSCLRCPIYTLATYLEGVLRPIVDKAFQATAVSNNGDFVQKLDYFCKQANHVTDQSSLATFEVIDLYANVPHDALLTVLSRFLHAQSLTGRLETFTIDAFQQLISLVLRNNLFVYESNIYRYMRGCPVNLPIVELLGGIYMHYWQMPLMRHVRLGSLFYGRYHHTGFFTWDSSATHLQLLFNKMKESLPVDLQLRTSIGGSAHFLHCHIENLHGRLQTRAYHDPTQQPFLLPYAAEHPRLTHRQWFRFALTRAGRACATFAEFDEERLRIELTFLANGYSLDFTEYHLRQFFQRFTVSHQRYVRLDDVQYTAMRQQLFRQVHQEKNCREEEQTLTRNRRWVTLHYLFDWGARAQFNAHFYELWCRTINEDPKFKSQGLKIVLKSKHCYTSYVLLAQPSTAAS